MFKIPQLTRTHCNLSLRTANLVIGWCYFGFGLASLLGVVCMLFGGDSVRNENYGFGAMIGVTLLSLVITSFSARFLLGIFKEIASYMLPFIVLILFIVICFICSILTMTNIIFSILYFVPHVYFLLIMHSYYSVMKGAVNNATNVSNAGGNRALHV